MLISTILLIEYNKRFDLIELIMKVSKRPERIER